MATSTGKTVALILLVAFLVLMGWRLTPLVMAPFGAFTGVMQAFRTNVATIHFKPWGVHLTTVSLFSILLFFLWLAVIIWVYRDAERRGMNGILWALLVLIGNLIGLLIYLIVRTDELPTSEESRSGPGSLPCPSCRKMVATTFTFCPHCGIRLDRVCPQCGKSAERNWKLCPHCGEKLPEDS